MFGRVDLCDFVLEHPTISRFHAGNASLLLQVVYMGLTLLYQPFISLYRCAVVLYGYSWCN